MPDIDLSAQTMETAKNLAPWRKGMSWIVVLIEGIIIAAVGILILIDVQKTNRSVGLIFTAALAIAGLVQLWERDP